MSRLSCLQEAELEGFGHSHGYIVSLRSQHISYARPPLAVVLAIATEGDMQIKAVADDVLYIPKVHPILQPIVTTLPLQLLAYYIGVEKGLNVDRPRNLAKSVTVE